MKIIKLFLQTGLQIREHDALRFAGLFCFFEVFFIWNEGRKKNVREAKRALDEKWVERSGMVQKNVVVPSH